MSSGITFCCRHRRKFLARSPEKTPESLVRLLARKTTPYFDRRSGSFSLSGRKLILASGAELELENIRRVVLIGPVEIEAAALYNLSMLGIETEWLDSFGRPQAQLVSLKRSPDLFLKSQLAFGESEAAFQLARNLILAKVDNCHEILRRRLPETRLEPETRLQIATARTAAELRGLEGAAAKKYFSGWQGKLHGFEWHGRKPHPAPDPVNFLLSTGYGLLRNRLAAALRHAGLNPRLGFFHESRGSHLALASDLMEPLRALVDTCVLRLVRRQEVKPAAFRMRGYRCICGDSRTFVKILKAFEEMFDLFHNFYPCPEDNTICYSRSVNDMLDDLAESFAWHTHDSTGCLVPRLARCVTV